MYQWDNILILHEVAIAGARLICVDARRDQEMLRMDRCSPQLRIALTWVSLKIGDTFGKRMFHQQILGLQHENADLVEPLQALCSEL